jgi:hypothetical protein
MLLSLILPAYSASAFVVWFAGGLGAWERLDENASTTSVAIYGIILYTSLERGQLWTPGTTEYAAAIVLSTPKKNAE